MKTIGWSGVVLKARKRAARRNPEETSAHRRQNWNNRGRELRMAGLLISFEGTEGCGKSTQARLLADRLRKLGRDVLELREPGGTPLGEELRHTLKHSPAGRGMVPEAELLLMNAARAQLVREVIRPAISRGAVVLCDRFLDSTVAYQAWGRGLDAAWVARILEFAVGTTRPDLTFLFEVSEAIAGARRAVRASGAGLEGAATDRFEAEGSTFFARVAEGYRAVARAEPQRVRVVDATGTPGEVADRVWQEMVVRCPEMGR